LPQRGRRAAETWLSTTQKGLNTVAVIENQRLSRVVADRLQERIIVSGLSTGMALPTEPEIMEEFGVSRTVVREAAALLISRGLVEVRPRRGMTVRAPDGYGLADSLVAQLRMSRVSLPQLLRVRETLECAIARLAALDRTEEDLGKLRANLDEMAKASLDRGRTIELDMAFHELLSVATHNPFFLIVTRPVNELLRNLYIDRVGYMSLRELTLAEHGAIFAAIAVGDPDAADRATRDHLERIGGSVERLMADIAPTGTEPRLER
jgi:DNA-binding FadR family transcriptional regulator